MADDVLNIRDELIFIDYEAKNQNELLKSLGKELERKGYVKNSYIAGIMEREKVFPTGLQTKVFPIAIPHTDAIHVNENAVIVAKLKNPIEFYEMGNSNNTLKVQFIFMLALSKSHGHIKVLGKLMSILSDENLLTKLKQSISELEIKEILKKAINS